MGWLGGRSSLAGRNFLDLIPQRIVTHEAGATPEKVVLLLPRYRDWFFGRIVQPLLRGDKRFIRVPLDGRGSWLWSRVDGQRTAGEIALDFRSRFPEDDEQVEQRVSQYLGAMISNGFMEIQRD